MGNGGGNPNRILLHVEVFVLRCYSRHPFWRHPLLLCSFPAFLWHTSTIVVAAELPAAKASPQMSRGAWSASPEWILKYNTDVCRFNRQPICSVGVRAEGTTCNDIYGFDSLGRLVYSSTRYNDIDLRSQRGHKMIRVVVRV